MKRHGHPTDDAVSMRDYVDTQVTHARELDELRAVHAKELADAKDQANADHFETLNRNAERTIEERGHFVTHEAFDPFKEAVLKAIAANAGATRLAVGLIAFASLTIAAIALFRR